MNLYDILRTRGFDMDAQTRMLRHQDKSYDMEILFRKGMIEAYQSVQGRDCLNCDYIIAFTGRDRSKACFAGRWKVIERLARPDPRYVDGFPYSYLSDPIRLIDGLGLANAPQEMQSAITNKAQVLAKRITRAILQQDDKVMVRQILKQIVLEGHTNGYILTIDLGAVAQSLEFETDNDMGEAAITVSLELKVCNNGKKVIISNKPVQSADPNPALISAIKSAHEIKAQYMNTEGRSLSKIAADLSMDARQVWRTLKLAYLAPDIQLAILSGTQPKGLLLKDLIYQAIPTNWDEQQTVFGFA